MSVDLSTKYLGFKLPNPLIASAGPLTGHVESLQRLEQAGISAAVLPSLFEEQIEHEEQQFHALHQFQTNSFAESLSVPGSRPPSFHPERGMHEPYTSRLTPPPDGMYANRFPRPLAPGSTRWTAMRSTPSTIRSILSRHATSSVHW